jgi:Winged helix DNA-binding domain
MQAQEPLAPYTGLWTRLNDFDPDDLSRMTETGEVVRGTLMRRTVHLVTADDFGLGVGLVRVSRGFQPAGYDGSCTLLRANRSCPAAPSVGVCRRPAGR